MIAFFASNLPPANAAAWMPGFRPSAGASNSWGTRRIAGGPSTVVSTPRPDYLAQFNASQSVPSNMGPPVMMTAQYWTEVDPTWGAIPHEPPEVMPLPILSPVRVAKVAFRSYPIGGFWTPWPAPSVPWASNNAA